MHIDVQLIICKSAKQMESLGARELILVAQDTTRYGIDLYGEYSLDKLLEKLLSLYHMFHQRNNYIKKLKMHLLVQI